ncbi:MAG: penicillin-insensitive murein endopeptidase [Proteobacteria bacterium]|nr:penicillin-insensitive murein endopeptidase [Pseudomonadota bacterium]
MVSKPSYSFLSSFAAATLLGGLSAAGADPTILASTVSTVLLDAAPAASFGAPSVATSAALTPSTRSATRTRARRALATRGTAQRRSRHRRRYRRIHGLVQLTDRPGLKVRTPDQAWGTALTVQRLSEVMTAYHEHFPEASPIWVHDLSRRWGGRLRPHLSHDTGQDVDIRVVLKRETLGYARATPRTLDLERTWFLLLRLIDTGDVQVIFLDRRLQRALYVHARAQGYAAETLASLLEYPGRRRGLVRHWRGHADHLHVRFRRQAPRRDLALRSPARATPPPA